MNFKAIILSIFAFFSKLFSHNILAQPIDLSGEGWLFSKGDDMQWATPQYNDSTWQKIAVGMTWQAALNTEYNGMAWYRRSIIVPENQKKLIQKGGGLILKLGMIDDADETYFNGIKIGATGLFSA